MESFIITGPEQLPVGSVVEQRRDGRTVLLVQETPETATVVESWEDALDLANRLLARIGRILDQMNADRSALNQGLAESLAVTGAKIAENQRLLDRLINDRP
jgi:hypothetical protein